MICKLINHLKLIIDTVKFLKTKQILYQILYRLKKFQYSDNYIPNKVQLSWNEILKNNDTYTGNKSFNFINIKHHFKNDIDWNEKSNDKLWLYHLNYFEYLNQKNMTKEEGLFLIEDYINNYPSIKDGKEPYPSSLRIINYIKFISKNDVKDLNILKVIKEDANRLSVNLEYHLLGNHILENGFALWFAANLFNDKRLYKISNKIFITELDEQILSDGAHFELSPMYHIIILYRVLDCINLDIENPNKENKILIQKLRVLAPKMLSWLHNMTFKNGSFPLFNDSANGVVPTPAEIFQYASLLGIKKSTSSLDDSGYRDFRNDNYELIADVGEIKASYQPAHAHADTFSFVLNVEGVPIIVDRGISTYNISKNRLNERSTKAHNTITINDKNSSDVWSSFRVGKRAKTKIKYDSDNILSATHNGYKNLKSIHYRKWTFEKSKIIIDDKLGNDIEAKAYLHFHPKSSVSIKNKIIFINENIEISFKNLMDIRLLDYSFNSEFNNPIKSMKAEISFKKDLLTSIKIK